MIHEGQEFKTSPHFSGGNRPKWTDTFTFEAKTFGKLKAEVWSRAVLNSDSVVGKGSIDLTKLKLIPGKAIQCNYKIT